MNKNDLNKQEMNQIHAEKKIRRALFQEKIFALIGTVITLTVLCLGLYWTVAEGRLEIVYLNQGRIDSPTILPKMRTNASEVQVDRWIRGFSRRVVAYTFVRDDDSDQFAERAARWMHAHTSKKASIRFSSIMSDLQSYNDARKEKFAAFIPITDPSSVQIRQSGVTNSVFFIKVPGSYHVVTKEGETLFDAKLKLVVEKTSISGIPSSFGEINRSGLQVTGGTVEFVEDVNKPSEVTIINLFSAN